MARPRSRRFPKRADSHGAKPGGFKPGGFKPSGFKKSGFRGAAPRRGPQRDNDFTETPTGYCIPGIRAVGEAIKNPRLKVDALWLLGELEERADLQPLLLAAAEKGIMPQHAGNRELDELVDGSRHQGIVCRIRFLPQLDWPTLLNNKQPNANLLVLDQVQDPMNLGAILRSANAYGVSAVIVPKDNAVRVTPTVVKASAGAALYTPVVAVTNLARSLEELKEHGYWVVVLESEADILDGRGGDHKRLPVQPIQRVKPNNPWVLVAGSEGHGVRPLVSRSADYLTTIPMLGQIASLNVAAACAVALFSLTQHNNK